MQTIKFLMEDNFHEIITLWQDAGLSHRPLGRDMKQNISKQMTQPNTKFVGLYIDSRLTAAAIVSHNGRKGWINRLAVAPDKRRKNIAGEMIQFCENWLAKEGIEIFAVLIEDDNQASMNLFHKHNYVRHDDIIYFTKRTSRDV